MRRMPRYQVSRRVVQLFVISIVIAAFAPAILNMAVRGGGISLHNVARWFGPNLVIAISIGGLGWLILPRWAPSIMGGRVPLNWILLVATLLTIAAAGLLFAFALLSVVGFHEKACLCQANSFTACHSLISEFSGIAAGPRPGRAQRAGGKP
jgi:hypothetical protein